MAQLDVSSRGTEILKHIRRLLIANQTVELQQHAEVSTRQHVELIVSREVELIAGGVQTIPLILHLAKPLILFLISEKHMKDITTRESPLTLFVAGL